MIVQDCQTFSVVEDSVALAFKPKSAALFDENAYKAFVVWMEVNAGWKEGHFFQEETIPRGVGESNAGNPHSTTPQPSMKASLCSIGDKDTRARSKATCCKRGDKRKRCSLCASRDGKTSIMC